ncbi:MAG TPA: hypothetical protein VIF57_30850 [Polyangia bacterium]|jgi:hypothetical protein
MTPRRARAATVAAALLVAVSLAGCHDDPTEVVLVIESDLIIPGDIDGLDVTATSGPFAPSVPSVFVGSGGLLGRFPQSIGFISYGGTATFSFVLRLFHGLFQTQQPTLIMSRAVTDVRFVDQRTLMLVLQMPSACACMGSTCPTPESDPRCANIQTPALVPFDPLVAPPSSMMAPNGPPSPPQGIP